MAQKTFSFSKIALAWFAAGAGWDLQGRVLDHVLDGFIQGHAWLSFLAQ